MIYKVIEDKKWEYDFVDVTEYELKHNQLNSMLNGDDGWEAYGVWRMDANVTRFFIKRSYIEKKVEDEKE